MAGQVQQHTMSKAGQAKGLPSQLDEIGDILGSIASPLPPTIPSVAAFQQLGIAHQPSAKDSAPDATQSTEYSSVLHSSTLDWSALPAAVDADSTSMGVSTRKLTAKQQAKQRPVDAAKVQARVARKRAQVESFWLVLHPLLQAAGHTASPNMLPAPPSSRAAGAHVPCESPGQQWPPPQQQQQQQCCLHQQLSPGAQQQQQQQEEGQQESCPPHDACNSQPALQPQGLEQQHPQQPPLALHIVDFGCGTGNLLLPLAALLPHCHFTGVDMKPAALQRLQQRAAAAGLSNVSVFPGMIEVYREPFDVALALHACGNATDHVLQMAVDQAAAFVVSPCCVGKLRFSLTGGSSFHSQAVSWTPTAPGDRPVQQGKDRQQPQQVEQAGQQQQNQQTPAHAKALGITPTHQHLQRQPCQQLQQLEEEEEEGPALLQQEVVAGGATQLRHPRSDWLLAQLPDPERHFRIMAKVADISHAPAGAAELSEALKHRAAVGHTCKRFVEWDRCAAAAEAGYAVGLFKVLQSQTMAKNDLLIGLPTPAAVMTTSTHPAAAPAGQGPPAAPGSAAAAQEDRGCAHEVHKRLCLCGAVLVDSGLLYTRSSIDGHVGDRAA